MKAQPEYLTVHAPYRPMYPSVGRLPNLRIPWAMIAPFDAQAKANHCGQGLCRLQERHGVSACEALAILECRPWQRMDEHKAYLHLKARIEKWESNSRLTAQTKSDSEMKNTAEAEVPYDSAADTAKHIDRVNQLLTEVRHRLAKRGEIHDASKLLPPEKEIFDEWTPVLAAMEYGSTGYMANLENLRPALAHHYANNSHHPEHFRNGVAGMSLLDLVEMFCDWKAAGERHADGGDIMRSVELNSRRYVLDPQLVQILRNTALEMGWIKEGAKAE